MKIQGMDKKITGLEINGKGLEAYQYKGTIKVSREQEHEAREAAQWEHEWIRRSRVERILYK